MEAHRLGKQFDVNLRDLKILRDHPHPSVKYEFSFPLLLNSVQQAQFLNPSTELGLIVLLNHCNVILRVHYDHKSTIELTAS
jgi:hypothetical protein